MPFRMSSWSLDPALKDVQAAADTAEEHLQQASDRNDQPLEKDVICTTDAEAQVEATTDMLNVCLEETQTEDNQLLTEMVVNKRDPPEEEPEIRKRKNRRGTRGKGRKINYNKGKVPPNHTQDEVKNDSTVSGHRGRAEGVRSQHHQEKRKTLPVTPRPKTDSHQQRITETHDRSQRPQQVFVTRPSSEQDIDQSNAVPYTMTFYRTGWRGRRRTEGSRVECTPPRTDSNADRGRAAGVGENPTSLC
ncbi:hypothetical protein MHYP_G00279880 [Metynnis hypsauchen]